MTYAGARYLNGSVGKWISQDPVSLALGDWKEVDTSASISLGEWVRDPQRFNTYAYAGNNPIKNIDQLGKDYLEISANAFGGNFGAGAGVRIDPARGRVDIVYSGAAGAGLSGDISGSYNFGDLPNNHVYISTGVETTLMVGPGEVVKFGGEGTVGSNDPGGRSLIVETLVLA